MGALAASFNSGLWYVHVPDTPSIQLTDLSRLRCALILHATSFPVVYLPALHECEARMMAASPMGLFVNLFGAKSLVCDIGAGTG